MMKITGLSHLFKWENLHNWWLTKYFLPHCIYGKIFTKCFFWHKITFIIFDPYKFIFGYCYKYTLVT